MIASLLLALLVTFSGTVATYLYDENASLGARLCAGAALGLAALGLIGFVVASLVGLSGAAVLFSAVICCSPLALLTDGAIWAIEKRFRRRFNQRSQALHKTRRTVDRLLSFLRCRRNRAVEGF